MIYLFLAVLMVCVLLSAACVVVSAKSIKREERWRDSMRSYFQNCCSSCERDIQAYVDQKCDLVSEGMDDIRNVASEANMELRQKINDVEKQMGEAGAQIEGLKLDYREAQAAANHINDYAAGLEKIFYYDEADALKKSRKGSGA